MQTLKQRNGKVFLVTDDNMEIQLSNNIIGEIYHLQDSRYNKQEILNILDDYDYEFTDKEIVAELKRNYIDKIEYIYKEYMSNNNVWDDACHDAVLKMYNYLKRS